MNVFARVDLAGQHLTSIGLDMRDLAAATTDPQQRADLTRMSSEVLSEAEEVEDLNLDIECARQVLKLGRQAVPSPELRRKIVSFERSARHIRAKRRPQSHDGDAA